MHAQKSLGLSNRFKSSHTPLSNPGRLVRKLSPIIGILRCIMNRIGNDFSRCDAIASQFISDYFPELIVMRPQ
jgi:hypothetical protein